MMRIDVDEWQIRSFRTHDVEALARYANNRNVSRNLRDEFPYPYTLAHAETLRRQPQVASHQGDGIYEGRRRFVVPGRWISFAAQQFTESDFAIASETELIGGIGLSDPAGRSPPFGRGRVLAWGAVLGTRHCHGQLRCGRSPNTPFRSLICCGCTAVTSTSGIPPRPGSWTTRPATSARAAYAKVS